MRPFAQLRFEDVPEVPRLPHPYFDTRAETLRIASVPFGDVDVHVRIAGSGPPLVLIHGLMTTSYSWRYVIEPLSRRFTLYMPDLVGSGRSSKPDRPYGPDAMADAIGEIVRALGVRGAPVIGNSMGGYLCMRLARRDPGAMGRLCNVHSPGLPIPRLHALAWALWLVPFHEAVVRGLVWRDAERWVHRNVHYWDETLKSREEHREYAAPLRSPEGLRAFVRHLSDTLTVGEMAAFERSLRADPSFAIPLWLVYAERDPMVPPDVGQRLRELIPEARFVSLPEASHFMHVDATDRFLAAIEPFLVG